MVRSTTYTLTSQRLLMSRGVLSKRTEEIELYRVKDWALIEPLALRLLGKGHIALVTTDATAPHVMLNAITDPKAVRELIRLHVEAERDRKRVRQVDVEVE